MHVLLLGQVEGYRQLHLSHAFWSMNYMPAWYRIDAFVRSHHLSHIDHQFMECFFFYYSWFTILCWFSFAQQSNPVIHTHTYIYVYSIECEHCKNSTQSGDLSSLPSFFFPPKKSFFFFFFFPQIFEKAVVVEAGFGGLSSSSSILLPPFHLQTQFENC